MDINVNIEINISEATKAFIRDLIGAAPVHCGVAAEELTAPETAVVAIVPEEKPAEAKKPARKAAKKEEPVEAPAEPEQPAEAAKPAPVKEEKPADEVDYAKLRKETKAYCSQRKAEGVPIPRLVHEFMGRNDAKFSEIPDEKLAEFRQIVESAEAA